MTGKLLGVTESIAAMNLRIFAGVVFCIILLVATFVVNVIAFDYAKTEKASGEDSMMRDKDSGKVVNFHTATEHVAISDFKTLNKEFIRQIREIDVNLGFDVGSNNYDGQGHYMIEAQEELPCPEGHADKCNNGKMYVLYPTTSGRVFYVTYDGAKFSYNVLADHSLLTPSAHFADRADHPGRKLLQDICPWYACEATCYLCM